MGNFRETFNRILQGIKSLAPTDPKGLKHIVYQPLSINAASNGDFFKKYFQPLYLANIWLGGMEQYITTTVH